MAAVKILANGCTLTVDGSLVGGITSISLSNNKTDADTTNFNSAGRMEHMPALRGSSVAIESKFIEDNVTGVRDAGQAKVVAMAALVGPTALKTCIITTPAGITYTFTASANITSDIGGGNADAGNFNFELVVSGAIVIA
jgi:hypothetical protein